jgi:hypothetical protein
MFCHIACAENIKSETFLAKDRYEVSGSFVFNSSADSGRSNFRISPGVGYFIKDRLSVNAVVGAAYSSTTTKLTGDYGLGATYYLKTDEQYAPFVSQSFYRTFGSSDPEMGGMSQVGVLNFIAPNLAFKTSLAYDYSFERSINKGSFYIIGIFSLFL